MNMHFSNTFSPIKTSCRKTYCLLIFLILPAFSNSQTLSTKLDNYLTQYYTNKNVPSISAGISINNKIAWFGAKGFADIENQVPSTTKTLYRIASISKSITAVAIMQLVEEGKINLDADARNYIPYFPAKKWKFTTRQLLTHTSGIRDYRSGEFNNKDFFSSTKDVVNYLSKDSLSYEPGTKYIYSTLAYNLLASIIENMSGLSFKEYLTKRIFESSGMTSTNLELQKQIVLNRARGYERNLERELINAPLADLSIKYSGGGIISTTEDLLNFAINLLEGKLIKLSTLDSMLVPVKLKNGEFKNYGLGFSIGTDDKGKRFFSHSGGGTGFVSLLIIYPTEKLAAVHLINLRDRNLGSPATDLASITLNTEYEIPKISLADRLVNITLTVNIDSALSYYKSLKAEPVTDIDTSANELLLFGADLISMQDFTAAVKFYKHLLSENQKNVNAYIGLADAYNKDGNIGLALNNYRKALRIEPLNDYAARMIRKLEGRK